MSYFKTGRLIVASTAVWACLGCVPKYSVIVARPKVASIATERIIYELLIRNFLKDESSGKIILVSLGESWVDPINPPDDFIERLADMDVILKPVSQRSQLSKPNALLFSGPPERMDIRD